MLSKNYDSIDLPERDEGKGLSDRRPVCDRRKNPTHAAAVVRIKEGIIVDDFRPSKIRVKPHLLEAKLADSRSHGLLPVAFAEKQQEPTAARHACVTDVPSSGSGVIRTKKQTDAAENSSRPTTRRTASPVT